MENSHIILVYKCMLVCWLHTKDTLFKSFVKMPLLIREKNGTRKPNAPKYKINGANSNCSHWKRMTNVNYTVKVFVFSHLFGIGLPTALIDK